jgi:DNA mismatch repair protein MutS
LKPLKDKVQIEKRLDFVEAFLNDKILLDKVRADLSNISSITFIMNRVALNRATPRDLLNLKNSLKAILRIFETIKLSGNEKLIDLVQ